VSVRGTPADLLAEAQSADLSAAWLVDIHTGTSPAIVYVTTWNVPLTFPTSGGNVYVVRPMEIPEIGLGEESEGGGVRELKLGDADEYWTGLGRTGRTSGSSFAAWTRPCSPRPRRRTGTISSWTRRSGASTS